MGNETFHGNNSQEPYNPAIEFLHKCLAEQGFDIQFSRKEPRRLKRVPNAVFNAFCKRQGLEYGLISRGVRFGWRGRKA